MKFYLACRWHKCHFCELCFVQAPKCLLHMYIFQSELFTKGAIQFHNLACTCQFWKPCVCKVNKFLSQFLSLFKAKESEVVILQAYVNKLTSVSCRKCFDPSFNKKIWIKLTEAAYNCNLRYIDLWIYKIAQFIVSPLKICCFWRKLKHLF